MDAAPLIERARSWLSGDPDPETRAELEALIQANDLAALADRFDGRLEFGTAGMRGAMAAGPNRMNRALVRIATAGLAAYLPAATYAAQDRGVVIGYDGRHKSRAFAEEAAAVLAGAGFRVYLSEEVVPTPVLAFAVLHVRAAAGIMVTASHNPPADNGYKVYWENGAQIIPPHDALISEQIDAIGGPGAISPPSFGALVADGKVEPIPDAVWSAYQAAVLALRVHPVVGARAVYTAMHGVGYASLQRVLAAAGHLPLIPVLEQVEPDGDFPTVAFPNPEEPGAMDLALARARASTADLVIAHDPDADRLAVAIPTGEGDYRMLTGNEVGVLLAEDLLTHGAQAPDRLVATTIVSTSLLGRIAEAHGAAHKELLTGFKWIANAAIDWPGPFVVGFEEALGYSVGPVVRDKDGVSAALIFLDMASWLKEQGISLEAHLGALYKRYGYYSSAQHSLKLPGSDGAARIAEIMEALRANPPKEFAGIGILQVRDLDSGEATVRATGASRPLGLPRSNVLAYDMAEGCRVLVRPSGTEPKIKFYFEVRVPLEGGSVAEAATKGQSRIAELRGAVLAAAGVA